MAPQPSTESPAICANCGTANGYHLADCRYAPPRPKRILTPAEAEERERLLAERASLTPIPTADHNILRGAAAVAELLDVIGKSEDDIPDIQNYVAKIICDNEMDLRALLGYALSCVTNQEVPL